MITIPWRDEVLSMSILRASGGGADAAQLTDNVSSKWLRKLEENIGYPETVMWYWLVSSSMPSTVRSPMFTKAGRNQLTRGTGFGSKEVHNQVAGPIWTAAPTGRMIKISASA